jgi:hypothetical protein
VQLCSWGHTTHTQRLVGHTLFGGPPQVCPTGPGDTAQWGRGPCHMPDGPSMSGHARDIKRGGGGGSLISYSLVAAVG